MTRLAVALCLSLVAGPAHAADRITPIDAGTFGAELEARKGRVLLVNFWATWCRPCLDEIPALRALEEEFRAQGFELLAVSLDNVEDFEVVVEPFMEKWFPEFETYISLERDMDSIVSVIDPYWNEVLPTSYVVGRDGSVVERIQGGSTAEEFTEKITPLL